MIFASLSRTHGRPPRPWTSSLGALDLWRCGWRCMGWPAPKIVTVTKGWWDAYSMFLDGEADMVLSYSTSPAYHIVVDGTDKYRAASFDEGHYMQVEVAAMLKNAPQPELAGKFMDFILDDGFQSVIPTTNWMYPAGRLSFPRRCRVDHTIQVASLHTSGCC